jgi:hypothetical protein
MTMPSYPIELFNMQRGKDWLRIHFADDELILYKLRGVCGDKYERLHHLNEVSSETWCKLKGWFSDGFSSISKPAVLGGLPDTKWSLRAEYLGLDEERRHECIVTQLGQEGHLKRRILSARQKQDASDADKDAANAVAVDCVIHLAIGMLFPWDVYLYKPDGQGRWVCDDESKCYDTPLPDPPLETPLHLLNSI